MSALAGIFNFDPMHPVSKPALIELARGVDYLGPDGGSEHVTSNVAMAYRAFHSTPESRLECQPSVRDRIIFTWDGRLDNRRDLVSQLNCGLNDTSTDIDIVFEAYRTWGVTCFRKLIGDWALALWDDHEKDLILARDYIGVRRLFYRQDCDGITWCTAPEPLVLTARTTLHLDTTYIAGCFYPRPPLGTTPYREICGITPGTFMTFGYGGRRKSTRFWDLHSHEAIRYRSNKDYEENFLTLLKESVRRRLRTDRPIFAELSGGVDSSSIVCIADLLHSTERGPTVKTISYYDPDEPSGDERPFYSIIEQKRGHEGIHVSIGEFTQQARGLALDELPSTYFSATPGLFARVLQWNLLIRSNLHSADSRVLLSWIGGDELLGGIPYEAPELAGLLASGNLISFVRSLIVWSVARKRTVYALARDAFVLMNASHDPRSLQRRSRKSIGWVKLSYPDHSGCLESFASWRDCNPAQMTAELVRYDLASQLTWAGLPGVEVAERRYPFLDRDLFTFLASIPREQILRPGHRRYLMRRALRRVVPDEILLRKTKWFGSRNVLATLRENCDLVRKMSETRWLSHRCFVDADLVRSLIDSAEHGQCSDGMALQAAIGVEQWLRRQSDLGIIESSNVEAHPRPSQTATRNPEFTTIA
jgi:asparagine synthase (glutamine-hydrolysing)